MSPVKRTVALSLGAVCTALVVVFCIFLVDYSRGADEQDEKASEWPQASEETPRVVHAGVGSLYDTPLARRTYERPHRAHRLRVGEKYRGVVKGVTAENEAIVEMDDKVVYIRGARIGDEISFLVTDDMGEYALAHLLAKRVPRKGKTPGVAGLVEGTEHVVTIREADRFDPEHRGVTWINTTPVIVVDAHPGERVRVRITDAKDVPLKAEVIERLSP